MCGHAPLARPTVLLAMVAPLRSANRVSSPRGLIAWPRERKHSFELFFLPYIYYPAGVSVSSQDEDTGYTSVLPLVAKAIQCATTCYQWHQLVLQQTALIIPAGHYSFSYVRPLFLRAASPSPQLLLTSPSLCIGIRDEKYNIQRIQKYDKNTA